MNLLQLSRAVLLAGCFVLLTQGNLRAQEEPAVRLAVKPADQAAVSTSSEYKVHIHAPISASMNRFSPLATAASPETMKAPLKPLAEISEAVSSEASATATTVPAVPSPGFYPDDLSYFGGALVTSAKDHPVYVDCPASCWGNPATFLTNLLKSHFMHVSDQYVGSTVTGRYTVGAAASVNYPILTALSDNDILQIVHSVASTLGTGYGHIYNIFLPKGVDECFVGTTQCYSPDNPSTFVFCAYHGSVTFSDIGHVLFTVEPYQDVDGCSILQPSPNGGLIDSTSSVLGHETFETITDPDPGSGWVAVTSLGVFGEEIGDLCPGVDVTAPFFEDPVSIISGKQYEVQPMYSNKYHACSFAP
jgi:hypothetical protein